MATTSRVWCKLPGLKDTVIEAVDLDEASGGSAGLCAAAAAWPAALQPLWMALCGLRPWWSSATPTSAMLVRL